MAQYLKIETRGSIVCILLAILEVQVTPRFIMRPLAVCVRAYTWKYTLQNQPHGSKGSIRKMLFGCHLADVLGLPTQEAA